MKQLGEINYSAYGIEPLYVDFNICDYEIKTPEQQSMINVVSDYIENIPNNWACGRGLVLIGNTDTGKTQILSTVIKHVLDRSTGAGDALLTTEYKMVMDIKRGENYKEELSEKHIIKRYVDCHFLAIDDIGVRKDLTDREKGWVYEVINDRYAKKKPTLISSNYDKKNLLKMVGKRVFGRITTRTNSPIIEFNWKDYSGVAS